MLFNSYEFIFLFFPLTLILFFVIGRRSHRGAAAWLTAASVFFYGWWNPAYVGLLLASIAFNYYFGTAIGQAVSGGMPRRAKAHLVLAIVANLTLLAYYKYANFFVANLNEALGSHLQIATVMLPLGISFFTFTQIAFLVDTYKDGVREYRFVHYALFVTYFPHLIAGPVLHHKEMMPQFGHPSTYRPHLENLAVGLTIFTLGLFKKVVLADGIAPHANDAFGMAVDGEPLSLFVAWGGALAYTLQLYFDFSGYSDMAIGLSRCFGIQLPLNFFSPYKAVNISDFWRRWHMTLSRFLRDYLYIALGGNRRGPGRRYLNLFTTMLLGGLWHGAGWTYVAWGALHGLYLVVNHGWQRLRGSLGQDISRSTFVGRASGRALTLLCVIVGWVFFRSPTFESALQMLKGMAGLNGVALPAIVGSAGGALGDALLGMGITFDLGGARNFFEMYAWIIALFGIALFAPNTSEVVRRFRPALDYIPRHIDLGPRETRGRVTWRPTPRWAVFVATLAAASILSLSRVSEFLYYQF